MLAGGKNHRCAAAAAVAVADLLLQLLMLLLRCGCNKIRRTLSLLLKCFLFCEASEEVGEEIKRGSRRIKGSTE